jgi:hypothetical protein
MRPARAKQPHGAVTVVYRIRRIAHAGLTLSRPVQVQSNRGSIRPGVALALALAAVLKIIFFLDQRQQPQRQERKHRDRYRDVIAAKAPGSRPSPCPARSFPA